MVVLESSYDGIEEERTFYYTASWQVAEERIDRDNDGTDDERAQQFWGVRYIDDAVAKRQDRDGDGVWTTATLDNWYYLTDVMFSVRGIADREGNMHTRVDYTPYGVAMHRYAVDALGDGSINVTDYATFLGNYNGGGGNQLEPGDAGYDPDADLNGDGITGNFTIENLAFNSRYNAYVSNGTNPSPSTGWIDVPGDANGPDNSVGYDGYWFDLAGATDAGSTGVYCVRHRTYDPGMGRWLERDPVGYVPIMSMYAYCDSKPTRHSDFKGLGPGDPSWDNYRPGQDPPKCRPLSDEWYMYSPVCSDPTWCNDKYKRRLKDIPGWTSCFASQLGYISGPTVACMIVCGIGAGPLVGACVAGCLGVATVAAIMAIGPCIDMLKTAGDTARGSYCNCIAWKARNCNKDNQEALVYPCPPGTERGTPVPPGWKPGLDDVIA